MRKTIYIILSCFLIFSFVGCGKEEPDIIVEESEIQEIKPEPLIEKKIPTVMLNGINYYETNRIINTVEGTTGKIKSFVSEDLFPNENEQSNFGVGYEYQVKDTDFAYIKINDTWHIFCSSEDPEETITFQDRTFLKKELSSQTLEWLEKYNKLTEEEQLATDSIPAELIDEVIFEVKDADMEEDAGEMQEESESIEDAPVTETEEENPSENIDDTTENN